LQINDDALGRCLDALYEKGVSCLYQTIGEAVVRHLDLPCDSVHLDSTSFHYDGQEKLNEGDFNLMRETSIPLVLRKDIRATIGQS